MLDEHGQPIVKYRYNGAVANKTLELLGRHQGMFAEYRADHRWTDELSGRGPCAADGSCRAHIKCDR